MQIQRSIFTSIFEPYVHIHVDIWAHVYSYSKSILHLHLNLLIFMSESKTKIFYCCKFSMHQICHKLKIEVNFEDSRLEEYLVLMA